MNTEYKFYCWSAYDPLFKGFQMVEDYFNEETQQWEPIPSYEVARSIAKENVSNHRSITTDVLGSDDGDDWVTIERFGRKNPYHNQKNKKSF